ncbi:MAG: response regulator [Phycisphaerae bacterium]|nr:response regulator [Phycisphaerae bacterium]
MARILIVDDDPDICEAVRLSLEAAGHHVASASNREEGMRMASNDRPDLLILDVMMTEPDDGIAMAQDLRRAGFDRPILMMSCISRVSGMSYGRDDAITPVDDFVEKPVSAASLCEKVNALLDRAAEGPAC